VSTFYVRWPILEFASGWENNGLLKRGLKNARCSLTFMSLASLSRITKHYMVTFLSFSIFSFLHFLSNRQVNHFHLSPVQKMVRNERQYDMPKQP